MNEYTVTNGRILHKGALYVAGDVIELDDSFAERLDRFILSNDKSFNSEEKATNDKQEENYDDYTIAELKKLVEKHDVDVIPTGKNGSTIKSDYVRALEKSN